MLVFVWSEAQMIYIWSSHSSGCHCHPIVSCFIKIQITGSLTFLVPPYPGGLGNRLLNGGVCVCLVTLTL